MEKSLSQFGRAMKELGIIQIYADSPQNPISSFRKAPPKEVIDEILCKKK